MTHSSYVFNTKHSGHAKNDIFFRDTFKLCGFDGFFTTTHSGHAESDFFVHDTFLPC
jgi:hypothetical protein